MVKKSPAPVPCERCSEKFCKIHRKISSMEIISSKVQGLVQWFSQTKTNKHTRAIFLSVKNYSAKIYEEFLHKVIFPDYQYFKNVNKVDQNFIHKLMMVINIHVFL